MSGTTESVHARIHDVADQAREAAPSSVGEAASLTSDSLGRVRRVAAGLAVALLGLTLLARWPWSRS